MKIARHIGRFLCLLLLALAATSRATPANKAALQRHYGAWLGKDLDRCATCHLPSANKQPESLDEFPHNPFGDRLRAVGKKLAAAGKEKDISTRLKMVADEDSDGDGVKNQTEILLGHNPGDAADKPTKAELAHLAERETGLRKYLASYQWRPFEPVKQPAEPRVKNRQWARNPIDLFIAAEHDAHGLKPRPEAPKEILLRRVYLDLIGLSPTPDEIAAFQSDHSRDAYEKVVERLLKDPRHGERWARHWMDVWRYSDWAGWSGGNQIRDSKPHIWRWRDWIIDSLNSDKGYDRMLTEMLAADELMPADTNALRATGFLVRNYKMLSREQWLEDTVKHTSQAFMGLTVGCAKCHNHMYDPISQKEYYQFRAIFEPHDVRTDRLPGQVDTAKDGLVRAFDAKLDAPTYFFIRGDERRPDTNRVIQPGVPKVLRGTFDAAPMILPSVAAHPDKRPFVATDLIRESERAIKLARTVEWEPGIQRAEAKYQALLAVLKTEETPSDEAAIAAKHAQDQVAVIEAKIKLHEADLALAKEKDDKEKAGAQKNKADAEKKLADAEKVLSEPPTKNFKPRSTEDYPEATTGRRTALAHWLANKENPLTARVAMNHLWLRHFGAGIVPTPADFGFNGKLPTDPALLDWLAAEFMKSNWSMKSMHRLIVTSATYRMASTPDAANAKIDPDNQFLWRMPSRRMEGEIVRDNLLYLAGDLDHTMGGPEIDQNQGLTSKRRSVYMRIAAEKEVEFLKIFDGPSVTECYMRHPTVVPQQALALANSQIALTEAKQLAQKLDAKTDADFIRQSYLKVLAREPKPDETRLCSEFLATEQKNAPAARARQNLILVLFNHNDFVTIR